MARLTKNGIVYPLRTFTCPLGHEMGFSVSGKDFERGLLAFALFFLSEGGRPEDLMCAMKKVGDFFETVDPKVVADTMTFKNFGFMLGWLGAREEPLLGCEDGHDSRAHNIASALLAHPEKFSLLVERVANGRMVLGGAHGNAWDHE